MHSSFFVAAWIIFAIVAAPKFVKNAWLGASLTMISGVALVAIGMPNLLDDATSLLIAGVMVLSGAVVSGALIRRRDKEQANQANQSD